MKWKQYPNYMCSKIKWLDQIPTHWNVRRLKLVCTILTGDKDTVNAVDDGKYPFFVRSQTIEHIDSYSFDGEAILTAGDGVGVGKVFHYYDGKFDFHQRVYMLSGFTYVSGKYLFHYLRENFHKVALEGGAKSTVDSLRMPVFSNFEIAFPSPDDQVRIIFFIERESKKIDTLIAEQRTLIEHLREKRLAEITRVVTEGLHSRVPTKDSGHPWFGHIPAHWEMKQLRHLTTGLDQGWSPQAEDHEADPEEWAVIKLSAIKQGRFIDAEHKTLPKHLEAPQGLEIQPGDLLFTRANTPDLVGDVCVVGETRGRLIFSDLVFRPRLDEQKVDAKFLMYFLLSRCGRAQIECTAHGSSQSMVKISQSMINAWQIPLPPLPEQREIARVLDRDMGNLDRLIAEAETSTSLLLEHRSALITAVVTGKVDVREVTHGA